MSALNYIEIHREPGNPHHLCPTSVEMDGWIALPDSLYEKFMSCGGYCNLVITDGVLVDVTPDENDPRHYYEEKRQANAAIEAAKAELTATDYKVLKLYEASVLGAEAPYDMATVAAERDALRATVNEAEATIASIDTALEEYYTAANASRSSWN